MTTINIIKYKSPNRFNGRASCTPDIIVCHITEGSYKSALNWMLNPSSKVASHFLIGKDGTIAQLVDLTNAAWCNGTSATKSSNVYYGKATNPLVKNRSMNANYYTISIEFEGIYATTKGALSDKQTQAAIDLIKWLKIEINRIYKKELVIDRNHLIGHYEINPVTKPYCPGKLFPFDNIIGQVNYIPNSLEQSTTTSALSEEETLKQEIDKLNQIIKEKTDIIAQLTIELAKYSA